MKETLSTKVGYLVEPHLQDGIIPPTSYKDTISKIHSKVVSDTISNYAPNRVLNAAPPKVNKQETNLPRLYRTMLAQLRSGHCSRLKDLQLRIGKSANDFCPECLIATQSTALHSPLS